MSYIDELGKRAVKAEKELGRLSGNEKNRILESISRGLLENEAEITDINAREVEKARKAGTNGPMLDRLRLDHKRIQGMADACLKLISLDDPVGKVISGTVRPNGMKIQKIQVPMGVIGIIFESRPNVTVDAATLCIKSGNAVILRGGHEALETNKALMKVMQDAIEKAGFDRFAAQIVEDPSHETAGELMRADKYLDLLIPRGGRRLIDSVVKNATVPVIETGTGNCHLYIDSSADIKKGVAILENGKTQRPGVCNALESLLVHRSIAPEFLPEAYKMLKKHGVEVRGCERTREILGDEVVPAAEEDYATEFLDYIISVKVVDDIDEAIAHIAEYSTGHSECIVTESYENAEKFQKEVDSACVYVNCSTRFTDGGEFGYGAEIGISTQKLHARGPMGLDELTTVKYLINGNGQIRP